MCGLIVVMNRCNDSLRLTICDDGGDSWLVGYCEHQ